MIFDADDLIKKGYTIHFEITFTPSRSFVSWCKQFPDHMDTAKYKINEYSEAVLKAGE